MDRNPCRQRVLPIRQASRVVLRTADGVKVVTDHVKRVRLRTEKGEKVVIDFRSANVTHLERVWNVHKRHPSSSGSQIRVPTKGLEAARLNV